MTGIEKALVSVFNNLGIKANPINFLILLNEQGYVIAPSSNLMMKDGGSMNIEGEIKFSNTNKRG